MNKTKKFYLIISAFFLLNVLTILAITVGSYLYLLNISSNLAEQKYYSGMLAEKERILKALEERYEEIKADIPLIESTLPDEKESSKLISDLNSISQKSGLIFVSVKTGAVKTNKNTSDPSLLQTEKGRYGYEMPLSVEVKGPYGNFVTFVKSIEKYQRLINITSVDIKRIDRGNTNDEIEATLKLTVYLKK